MSAEPVNMGILLAPSDKGFLQALRSQLTPAQRSQRIALWDSTQLTLGSDIQSEIASRLQQSQLIIPLLTPRFLADHHDWLDLALAQRAGGSRVVPVRCRVVMLDGSPFENVALLPGEQAIADVRNRDKIWTFVASKLLELVDELNRQPKKNIGCDVSPPLLAAASGPRKDLQPSGVSVHLPLPSPPSFPSPPATPIEKLKILFLGANPRDATHVDSLRELRQIDKQLTEGKYRDSLSLIQKWGVTIPELTSLLLEHKPHILHFSGHGSRAGKIVVEDGVGNGVEVPLRSFTKLLGVINDHRGLKCVVLSACYTAVQAQAIAEHVPCVVGIAKTISNDTAAAFSSGFYCALASGESFQKAFDIGRVQIGLLSRRKTSLRLYVMPGVDANTLRLAA